MHRSLVSMIFEIYLNIFSKFNYTIDGSVICFPRQSAPLSNNVENPFVAQDRGETGDKY